MRPTAVLLAVAVAVSVALAGCSTSGSEAATRAPSTSTTTAPGAADQDLLAALALDDGATRAGEQSTTILGGDQVAGQITLDYCGAPFATEGRRLARHQQAIHDATGEYTAGGEAVRYEPGQAARALKELRSAVDGCDEGAVADSTVAGVPDARWESTPIPDDRLPDVADDHVALDITITTEDGKVVEASSIYQRRGDVLVGSYSPDLDRAVDLANAAGRRLSAAPADQVGG